MLRRWSVLVSFLVVMGACFNPRYPEGIPCSEARTCPPGQTCDPVALVCRIDPLAPAPSDGAPTRPIDASPDTPSDGAPVLTPDAAESTPDAAAPVDASPGACADGPCGANSTCVETPDDPRGYTCVCDAGYVDSGDACRLPRTCLELLTSQPGSGDGLYVLDPDLDAADQPFETFCEMSTDGGGWTLVQRTVWDFAETSLLHTDYATFQGVLLGSPAPGQAFRVPGARWPALQETREHMMRQVPRRATDGSDCGALYYKATDGVWTVPATGGATLTGVNDPILLFNQVSTLSATDTGPSRACVNGNLGVPWLYGSCCNTCPSYQGGYWRDGAHPMSHRMTIADLRGETMFTRCAPEQPRRSDNNSSYYGINIMEYYLR